MPPRTDLGRYLCLGRCAACDALAKRHLLPALRGGAYPPHTASAGGREQGGIGGAAGRPPVTGDVPCANRERLYDLARTGCQALSVGPL